MERFTEENLNTWQKASEDLDALQDSLHKGGEAERRARRSELLVALACVGGMALAGSRWSRALTYKYSLCPLSCAGSLQMAGGRFNIGIDVDKADIAPWPALYLAEDLETAFREKYQVASGTLNNGLSAHEMNLEAVSSHSMVQVNFSLSNVFDMRHVQSLEAFAKEMRRIKMPAQAVALRKRLRISPQNLYMMQTALQLHNEMFIQNWRRLPMQFGTPANSQIVAELIRACGYEGIVFHSTKGGGACLAVFPDRLREDSFVELADAAPDQVKHTRMDSGSASDLLGWDSVPPNVRPVVG